MFFVFLPTTSQTSWLRGSYLLGLRLAIREPREELGVALAVFRSLKNGSAFFEFKKKDGMKKRRNGDWDPGTHKNPDLENLVDPLRSIEIRGDRGPT